MDLMGTFPQSTRGSEFFLVIISCATPYPEAVPLWKVTSKNIARELVLLFSRVGLLKDLLTNQGMLFMSQPKKDVRQLSEMKQVWTSVYHPQTDGLVKHFNQTLKRLLG